MNLIKPQSVAMPPSPLTEPERRTLRCAVALMIPASAKHDLPGADDETIFADIVRSLGRDARAVREALALLDALGAAPLDSLSAPQQMAVVQRLRQEHALLCHTLANVTTRCYYRDERTMLSLGMQARPPFPLGFSVEEGDWSLLDPVRQRPPLYRPV